ncbi:MAG: HAD family hydrolase [Clostridia bacterium]|nr:HAD family hydrolase [Clostridia bacterium]
MYNVVLFDLDGTLTDPGVGITNSVAYALKAFGIENTDRRQLYKFIGPPLIDSFSKYYSLSDEECKKAIFEYRVYFKEKGMFENSVYKDVPELLQTLKDDGKKLVIATSKPEEFAVTILKHFNLYKHFDAVCGASMDGKRSIKGDIIKYALDKCDITDLTKTVMIGDREHDIIGAKSVGIDSVGVLYGYGNLEELKKAGATYIAEEVNDILKFI